MSELTLYAVVTRDRRLKRRSRGQGGGVLVYESKLTAQRQCKPGDAVVEVTVDFTREPSFIRGEKL